MKLAAFAPFLLALAALCGCSTTSSTLRGLAQDQHDDAVAPGRTAEEALAVVQRSEARADTVCKLLEEKKIESAADHYYAALVLVQCSRESDLALAQQLGLIAGEKGEPRGKRVSAEALDKLMLRRGMMQRYGTQFVWEPVLRRWRLYPVDPRTTDEERKAMGVPAMAEIKLQEEHLNGPSKKASKSQ